MKATLTIDMPESCYKCHLSTTEWGHWECHAFPDPIPIFGCGGERFKACPLEPVEWIPVEDLLPETSESVLVTYTDDSDTVKVGWDYYMDGFWHASIFRTVIAWMPMPEAYEP